MTRGQRWTAFVLVGPPLLAAAALAQAPPAPAPPEGIRVEQLLLNDRVRVSRLRFEPGAAEAVHTHDFDLLAVLLTDGEVEMRVGEEKARERRPRLHVTFVPAGAPHALTNAGSTEVQALGIALLGPSASPGQAGGGDSGGAGTRVLFDNGRVRVLESAGAATSAGGSDRVVYALEDGEARWLPAGGSASEKAGAGPLIVVELAAEGPR